MCGQQGIRRDAIGGIVFCNVIEIELRNGTEERSRLIKWGSGHELKGLKRRGFVRQQEKQGNVKFLVFFI